MKATSPEYRAALEATVYQLVTATLAQAMVSGMTKRNRSANGAVYGTYNTLEAATKAREEGCKRYVPAGRNLETGRMDTMRTYTAVIVATNGEGSKIVS
jgi:hypothetical protein